LNKLWDKDILNWTNSRTKIYWIDKLWNKDILNWINSRTKIYWIEQTLGQRYTELNVYHCLRVCSIQYIFVPEFVQFSISLSQSLFYSVYLCLRVCSIQYNFVPEFVQFSISLSQSLFYSVYLCPRVYPVQYKLNKLWDKNILNWTNSETMIYWIEQTLGQWYTELNKL
jgi:hypothetical protein